VWYVKTNFGVRSAGYYALKIITVNTVSVRYLAGGAKKNQSLFPF